MSAAKRTTAIVFTVITIILALWALAGRVSILVNGGTWSDSVAMIAFSIVVLVLSLACAALWGSHARKAAIGFLVLATLAVVNLLVSLV